MEEIEIEEEIDLSDGDDQKIGIDETLISFDDGEDDAMADLFSFGASLSPKPKDPAVDFTEALASVMPLPARERSSSEDSLLEMLAQENFSSTIHRSNDNTPKSELTDKDTQEILDWLDDDDDGATDNNNANNGGGNMNNNFEEELIFEDPNAEPQSTDDIDEVTNNTEPAAKSSIFQDPPPDFDTLQEAIISSESTSEQVRTLFEQEKHDINPQLRPQLWSKAICGKTLNEIMQSNIAKSFDVWQEKQHVRKAQKQSHEWVMQVAEQLVDQIVSVTSGNKTTHQQDLTEILKFHYDSGRTVLQVVDYDYDDDPEEREQKKDEPMDPIIPKIVALLLSSNISKIAAAVMLGHLVKKKLPLLQLTIQERIKIGETIHRQFYLLACYHLPLLAFHFDRHIPDWYFAEPKGCIPQSWLISFLAGDHPNPSMYTIVLQKLWDLLLVTNTNKLLHLFFALVHLEKHSDSLLLLTGFELKEEIHKVTTFVNDMNDMKQSTATADETSACDYAEDWFQKAQSMLNSTPMSVLERLENVDSELAETTISRRKQDIEDRKRLRLEAKAKAQQEAAEAERERKADEARLRLTRARLVAFYRTYNPGKENNIDKIMKNYEGRYDVLDAKLKKKYGVGFNPAIRPKKVAPAPAPSAAAAQSTTGMNASTSKILASMNTGFGSRRQFFTKKKEDAEFVVPESEKREKVVVSVTPEEVLPLVCWSKQGSAGRHHGSDGRLPLKFYLVDCRPEKAVEEQGRFPCSVYLTPEILMDADKIFQHEEMLESLRGAVHICVMGEGFSALPDLYNYKMTRELHECIKEDDSRTSLCALFFIKKGFPFVSFLDGGFAGAHAWLYREGPDKFLTAPDVLTDYVPDASLFGQLEKLYQEQEGLKNATAKEKTQRALQNLFDSSMTALTKNTLMLENLASELESPDNRQKSRSGSSGGGGGGGKFFSSQDDLAKPATIVEGEVESNAVSTLDATTTTTTTSANTNGSDSSNKTETTTAAPTVPASPASSSFLNPFARLGQQQGKDESTKKLQKQKSSDSLEIESVDFDKTENEQDSQADNANNSSNVPRQIPNTFSRFLQTPANAEASSTSEKQEDTNNNSKTSGTAQPIQNRFAGLGAALKTIKNVPQRSVVNRNPFARFAASQGQDKSSNNDDKNNNNTNSNGGGSSDRFSSLSMLRKNTMAIIRNGVKDELDATSINNNGEVSEEFISLDTPEKQTNNTSTKSPVKPGATLQVDASDEQEEFSSPKVAKV